MEKIIASRYCLSKEEEEKYTQLFYQREGDMDNLPDCIITATTLDSEEHFEVNVTDGYYERMEKEMKEYSLNNAVNTICKELKEDESYYISWKSAIAMSFKDAYDWEYSKLNELEGPINHPNIHDVANKAADNFLKQLIG